MANVQILECVPGPTCAVCEEAGLAALQLLTHGKKLLTHGKKLLTHGKKLLPLSSVEPNVQAVTFPLQP